MGRTARILFLILTVLLLASLSYAYATTYLWNEEWLKDNIKTDVSPSNEYWVKYQDSTDSNITYSYSIADGVLTLNCYVAGGHTSQAWAIKRLANTTKGALTVSIKFMLYNVQGGLMFKLARASNPQEFFLFQVFGATGGSNVVYYNATGQTEKFIVDLTNNEWYILKLSWSNIPFVYNVGLWKEGTKEAIANFNITDGLYGFNEITEFRMSYADTRTTPTYSRIYIDYIRLNDYASLGADVVKPVLDIMPSLIAIGLLASAIAIITKATR